MKLPLALVGEIIRNSLLSFIFPFSRYIEFLGLYSPDTLDSCQFSFHLTTESKSFHLWRLAVCCCSLTMKPGWLLNLNLVKLIKSANGKE